MDCKRSAVSDHIFNRKHLRKRRKELRTEGTAPEAVLWTHLQKRKLEGKKFRRQQSIGPYIVDFCCPECRLIIELDGAPHYGILDDNYDIERTKYLVSLGFKILRFENRIILNNPEAALQSIRHAILIPL